MIQKLRNLSCMLALAAACLLASCAGSQVHQCAIYGETNMADYEGRTVYLTDPFTQELVDSAVVSGGKFEFPFPMKTDSLNARVAVLSVNHTDNPFYAVTLPVVLEKGSIRVKMGDMVSAEGTSLNKELTHFLISLQMKAESVRTRPDATVEDLHREINDLYMEQIRLNKDNPIGPYVYWAYRDNMDRAQWEALPGELGGEFEQKVGALRKGLK